MIRKIVISSAYIYQHIRTLIYLSTNLQQIVSQYYKMVLKSISSSKIVTTTFFMHKIVTTTKYSKFILYTDNLLK